MKDPTGTRSARIADAKHLLHLASQFPCLPFPSVAPFLVSFSYAGLADTEVAAGAVMTAEGILSRQLGVTFDGAYTKAVGSMQRYQRVAELASGLFVYITAQAAVGPLVDARKNARELAEMAA
jgi:hypothetical protein